MDEKVKVKRKYIRANKQKIIIRSDSEKMRQLQKIIDENEKLCRDDQVLTHKAGKDESDQSENLSKSTNEKNGQNIAAKSEIKQPLNDKGEQNVKEKQITQRSILEDKSELQNKKVKQDEKYEQRFCQMKAELQSFLCYWVMKLKDSVKDSQIMIEKLEKIQL